jgi:hypothetical protein
MYSLSRWHCTTQKGTSPVISNVTLGQNVGLPCIRRKLAYSHAAHQETQYLVLTMDVTFLFLFLDFRFASDYHYRWESILQLILLEHPLLGRAYSSVVWGRICRLLLCMICYTQPCNPGACIVHELHGSSRFIVLKTVLMHALICYTCAVHEWLSIPKNWHPAWQPLILDS